MSSFPKRLLMRCSGLLPERVQSALRRIHYQRKLTRARLTDEPDLAAIGLLTKPGDTVFDLGANFGLFTRFLSESVGATGRVFSFEPTADMFSVLSNNCSQLGLANTSVHRTALSDRTGTSEMVIPVRDDGSLNHYEASLAHGDEGGSDGKTITVETSTLDDFCSHHGIGKIDFIKCDVEGTNWRSSRGREHPAPSPAHPLDRGQRPARCRRPRIAGPEKGPGTRLRGADAAGRVPQELGTGRGLRQLRAASALRSGTISPRSGPRFLPVARITQAAPNPRAAFTIHAATGSFP